MAGGREPLARDIQHMAAELGKRAFEVEGTGRRSRRKRPVSTSGTTKP
jgi:hypothetical protein